MLSGKRPAAAPVAKPTALPAQSPEPVKIAEAKPIVKTPEPPAPRPAAGSSLRLADPKHPAAKQISEVAGYLNGAVEIKAFGDALMYNHSIDFSEAERLTGVMDSAVALAPEDNDLLVAKAGVLHAFAQYKTAEEVVDEALTRDPTHFEARAWKDHWESWRSPWQFPTWDLKQTCLHPVMAGQLERGLALQVVRDGLQKTLAIVAGGPPYAMNRATDVKAKFVLSRTPYGPVVAYYLRITEPGDRPHNMEMFVLPANPVSFTATEPNFLLQQLAFLPYCYVVLVNGTDVVLNRQVVFGPAVTSEVRDIARQLSEQTSFVEKSNARGAFNWHMNNFDMEGIRFE
jgi:hypothetical protein